MGKSVMNTYIGSYIEIENHDQKTVSNKLHSVGFFIDVFDDEPMPEYLNRSRFLDPYCGLEDMNILLPDPRLGKFAITVGAHDVLNDDWGGEEKAVETDFAEIHNLKKNVVLFYAKDIEKLRELFGDENVKVKAGFVHYIDEVG